MGCGDGVAVARKLINARGLEFGPSHPKSVKMVAVDGIDWACLLVARVVCKRSDEARSPAPRRWSSSEDDALGNTGPLPLKARVHFGDEFSACDLGPMWDDFMHWTFVQTVERGVYGGRANSSQ